MRITINNLDGLGPIDYTDVVPANAKGGSSLAVQRELNVPSRCTVEIVLGAEGLPMPARRVKTAGLAQTSFWTSLQSASIVRLSECFDNSQIQTSGLIAHSRITDRISSISHISEALETVAYSLFGGLQLWYSLNLVIGQRPNV